MMMKRVTSAFRCLCVFLKGCLAEHEAAYKYEYSTRCSSIYIYTIPHPSLFLFSSSITILLPYAFPAHILIMRLTALLLAGSSSLALTLRGKHLARDSGTPPPVPANLGFVSQCDDSERLSAHYVSAYDDRPVDTSPTEMGARLPIILYVVFASALPSPYLSRPTPFPLFALPLHLSIRCPLTVVDSKDTFAQTTKAPTPSAATSLRICTTVSTAPGPR